MTVLTVAIAKFISSTQTKLNNECKSTQSVKFSEQMLIRFEYRFEQRRYCGLQAEPACHAIMIIGHTFLLFRQVRIHAQIVFTNKAI